MLFRLVFSGLFISLLSSFVMASGDSARYRIVFDATWSQETHPTDFPRSPHFSGLIGGTHNADIAFWETGELATMGIEIMAETGGKAGLTAEVNAAIADGTAEFLLSGSGIGRSPNSTSLEFEVSSSHSLVTLVSMVAPSPDWFVGVRGLDLMPEGEWLAKSTRELLVYDSGTDSGPSFSSRNDNTHPAEPISLLDEFPFENAPPLGTFTFTRIIDGDFDDSGDLTGIDIDLLSAAVSSGNTDSKFDLNGDNTVDQGDRAHWISDLAQTYAGDSNLDGEFNTTDLTFIFQAGEYEDGIAGNSTWATGDWNGDADFDTTDLVSAFAGGGFEAGPRLAAQSVPEPSSISLLIGSALLLFVKRRV